MGVPLRRPVSLGQIRNLDRLGTCHFEEPDFVWQLGCFYLTHGAKLDEAAKLKVIAFSETKDATFAPKSFVPDF